MSTTPEHAGDTANAGHDAQQGRIPADTLSNRLILARALAGHLSIREACERTGLNRGNWQGWERGLRPRDPVEVCRVIADALDVDFNWLLLGGSLLGPRGRLVTKRTAADTISYQSATVRPSSVRPTAGRPDGRGDTHAPKVSRPVVRTHSPSAINDLVAATGSR